METYNQIVPMEYQDELLEMRQGIYIASFRIGDIANQIKDQRPDVPSKDIRNAVGSFVGKSARTVREYSTVAKFYPQAVRDEYEILAFDHFRVAMRYGDQWRDALDWAVGQVDELNRPATVDAMELQFGDQETRALIDEIEEADEDLEIGRLLGMLAVEIEKRYNGTSWGDTALEYIEDIKRVLAIDEKVL